MIVTIVILLLVVIFLAFFVGKNLSNVCTFWFFNTFENLPVAVLVLIAFGCGIAFTFLIFLVYKIKQSATTEEVVVSNKSEKKTRAQKLLEKEEKRIKKEKLQEAKKAKNVASKESDKNKNNDSSEVNKTSDNH